MNNVIHKNVHKYSERIYRPKYLPMFVGKPADLDASSWYNAMAQRRRLSGFVVAPSSTILTTAPRVRTPSAGLSREMIAAPNPRRTLYMDAHARAEYGTRFPHTFTVHTYQASVRCGLRISD